MAGEKFDRLSYREMAWKFDSQNEEDDTSAYIDLQMRLSGSFRFSFECERYRGANNRSV